jgi:hypothetical protein
MSDPNTWAKLGGQCVSFRLNAVNPAKREVGTISVPHGQARSAHAPEAVSMLIALQPA